MALYVASNGFPQRMLTTTASTREKESISLEEAGNDLAAEISPIPRCRGRIVKPCADCGDDFTGLGTTKHCPVCRYKPGNRKPCSRPKYVATPAIDAVIREQFNPHARDGSTKRIADQFGWSVDAVQKRAKALGLLMTPRVSWGEKDTAFVEKWAGLRSPLWIAEQLRAQGYAGRTRSAVAQKIHKLGLSAAVKEGYSGNELMVCFGVTEPTIGGWIRRGWLKATQAVQAHGRRHPWVITEEAIVAFIFEHPTAYRIRDVDQTWFLDLLGTHMQQRTDATRKAAA